MIKSVSGRTTHAPRDIAAQSAASRLTSRQEEVLEHEFAKGKTLHETDLALLAAEMSASESSVRDWYIQRVATWRRSQGLSDCFGQI